MPRIPPLLGHYYDPKHGGCLRFVRPLGPNQCLIDGVYGDDEPHTHSPWWAEITVLSRGSYSWKLQVDFRGKPTKRDRFLTATYHPRRREIRWCDGNTWRQLYTHSSQLQTL